MFVSTKKIWEDFTREVTIEHSLGRNSRILVDCLFKLFGRLFKNHQGFPGGSVVKKKKKRKKERKKNPPAKAGDTSSILISGKFHMPWNS